MKIFKIKSFKILTHCFSIMKNKFRLFFFSLFENWQKLEIKFALNQFLSINISNWQIGYSGKG